MKLTLYITLLVLTINDAFAGLSVGTSISYHKINDPNFEYEREFEDVNKLKSINVSYVHHIDDIVLSVGTNRLINAESKRKIRIGGRLFNSSSSVEYDVITAEVRMGRWIPSLFLSNVTVEREIKDLNKYQSNTSFVYGPAVGYMLSQKIVISLNYLMPNNELYLEGGSSLGINYNF